MPEQRIEHGARLLGLTALTVQSGEVRGGIDVVGVRPHHIAIRLDRRRREPPEGGSGVGGLLCQRGAGGALARQRLCVRRRVTSEGLLIRGREVRPVQPRVVVTGEVARVLLPGEPGYEQAAQRPKRP